MNVKFVFRIVGLTVFITSLFMIPPAIIAFIDSQMNNALSYLLVVGIMMVVSLIILIFTKKYKTVFYAQEGIAATSLSWIAMSLFGALPFCFTKEIPNYIDALFEIIS